MKSNNSKCLKKSKKLGKFFIARKMVFKFLLTMFTIFFITSLVVLTSFIFYIVDISSDHVDFDINATRLHLTSTIYVNNENGTPKEYGSFHGAEKRKWVDYDKIPESMIEAIKAVEDKRFDDHNGVDLKRTFGAFLNLSRGEDTYGGSTITQQLIKNLTGNDEVSFRRKFGEIFKAINFEKEHSKDEILEAYLNVVNFGNGCRGVQAAANSYFGKDIKDCSVAQCAAIAGITQNPAAYNPLVYPDNNKKRRDVILYEMYDQGKLSKEEYGEALTESDSMTFGELYNNQEEKDNTDIRNWYIDTLYSDIHKDLMDRLGMGDDAATDMILTQGLKIYCAMDERAQKIAEDVAKGTSVVPDDSELQLGYYMMGLDGRVLAIVGGKGEKKGNLIFNMATDAIRQPGSTIKPIGVYAPAIDLGLLDENSTIKDEPITKINGKDWPKNSYGSYRGKISIASALQYSSNAAAVQALAILTPPKSAQFLRDKVCFSTLDPADSEGYTAYATGGMTNGVSVKELTASFQIFGNGGNYYKPYTYYRVEDRSGKVLLSNEDQNPKKAISENTCKIMNKLLRNVVTSGTGTGSDISGWNIVGKTGTTDDTYDSWFVGLSPYAVGGVWIGYENPRTVPYYNAAKNIWRTIMSEYLSNKKQKNYPFFDKDGTQDVLAKQDTSSDTTHESTPDTTSSQEENDSSSNTDSSSEVNSSDTESSKSSSSESVPSSSQENHKVEVNSKNLNDVNNRNSKAGTTSSKQSSSSSQMSRPQ